MTKMNDNIDSKINVAYSTIENIKGKIADILKNTIAINKLKSDVTENLADTASKMSSLTGIFYTII